jgi:hypothetical protein
LFDANPLSRHFSETLLEDYDITELAQVGSFGPAASLYQKLFGYHTEEEETEFDLVCQKLNNHLIVCFTKCLEKYDESKVAKKKIRFNQSLVEFLQSKRFAKLVASC